MRLHALIPARRRLLAAAASVLTVTVLSTTTYLALPAAPTHATTHGTARVGVTSGGRSGEIAPTGVTALQLRGSGFQSVRGGFGGIYVLFGTVSGAWRPSAHGSGYLVYVPDSQTKANAGYQKFVAFPGDSTASAANGGTLAADGTWATSLRVPGPTFSAVGSDGRTHTVDCTRLTCGVITIGAHGVVNARNETFTPVPVGATATAPSSVPTQSSPPVGTSPEGTTGPTAPSTAPPTPDRRPARLTVDRATAGAGKVLAFTATGLPPGTQVSAVLDGGAAGAGPLVAGADGRLAGVLAIPLTIGPGTHTLRLVGAKASTARFAISPATTPASEVTASSPAATTAPSTDQGPSWPAVAFVSVAATLLACALLLAASRGWRRRRAA